MAEELEAHGITAAKYHAGMSNAARKVFSWILICYVFTGLVCALENINVNLSMLLIQGAEIDIFSPRTRIGIL